MMYNHEHIESCRDALKSSKMTNSELKCRLLQNQHHFAVISNLYFFQDVLLLPLSHFAITFADQAIALTRCSSL